MTRRRRLRHRLLWASVLLGVALLLAAVSVLRTALWARSRAVDAAARIRFAPITRKENTMYSRISLVVLAALGALLLAAPAPADGWGANRLGGVHAPGSAVATTEPAWVRALRLRSEALNRQYGLGSWELGISPAPQGDEPAWLRALRIRSEALNQRYKLGEHAPRS